MMQLTETKNYYELLGIDSNAPSNVIKKAYYLKIREFPNETHPEEFQELTKAYKILSDAESRTQYNHEIKDKGAYSKNLNIAIEFMDKEQYNSALYTLEEMLKNYPNNLVIQQNMAICYMSLEKYEDAKRLLLPLEGNHPNDEMNLSLLGQINYNLTNYNSAKDYYYKLVLLNPKENNYFISLSRTYYFLGEYQKALNILEEKLNQGKETVYDFPLLEELFFITMLTDNQSHHKKVISRIKKLSTTGEERIILLRMLMNTCENIENDNNGFKELINLVKDINGNENIEVNEWLGVAETYIRNDLIYYGDPQPSYQPSTQSTNISQSQSNSSSSNNYEVVERGSIIFSIILGIVASFFLSPIGGIIVGFVWYFNAGSLKKILSYLGCLAVIIVIVGILILSNM